MDFKKKNAIIQNLKNKHNITFEKFETDYYYCGGDYQPKLNYFYQIFKHYDCPKKQNICLCNTNIKKNCYVYDKETDHILILGSCCINKFTKNGTRKTCENCNEQHKNIKDNICNNCRKIKQQLSKYKKFSGFCLDCNKKIDNKYKYCYNCHVKHN